MAKQVSNGENRSAAKPPLTPSFLRFSKFFQPNTRILATGGAGFIGSHLVDKLMENGKNEVIVADNFFTGSKENLKKWIGHPRFELIHHAISYAGCHRSTGCSCVVGVHYVVFQTKKGFVLMRMRQNHC